MARRWSSRWPGWRWSACCRRARSVVEPEALEDPRRMFFDARGTGLRLLRSREMQQIAFLPPRGEGMKGLGQSRVVVQAFAKLVGHVELRRALHLHPCAGPFQSDS